VRVREGIGGGPLTMHDLVSGIGRCGALLGLNSSDGSPREIPPLCIARSNLMGILPGPLVLRHDDD
jgi:hypothetical protein